MLLFVWICFWYNFLNGNSWLGPRAVHDAQQLVFECLVSSVFARFFVSWQGRINLRRGVLWGKLGWVLDAMKLEISPQLVVHINCLFCLDFVCHSNVLEEIDLLCVFCVHAFSPFLELLHTFQHCRCCY